MKQQITKEQWNEVTEKQQLLIYKSAMNDENLRMWPYFPVSIGQMIEFLGSDLYRIINENPDKEERDLEKEIWGKDWTWHVLTYRRGYTNNELCDALWEAVKNKLKTLNNDTKKNSNNLADF